MRKHLKFRLANDVSCSIYDPSIFNNSEQLSVKTAVEAIASILYNLNNADPLIKQVTLKAQDIIDNKIHYDLLTPLTDKLNELKGLADTSLALELVNSSEPHEYVLQGKYNYPVNNQVIRAMLVFDQIIDQLLYLQATGVFSSKVFYRERKNIMKMPRRFILDILTLARRYHDNKKKRLATIEAAA
ncbi:DUF1845 family protein [Zooshikella marina]|uniref:AcaB family transcriptional regulator n=1 Tax=Zooshikella ganghwensis TaxID=202772 RepID=UPI000485CF24|nr:AcaB family transcriptional regulator [Zooshikella ganghwensis]MBU2708495.1 DUF1845 family protein [Zooshikella ganghwensis]